MTMFHSDEADLLKATGLFRNLDSALLHRVLHCARHVRFERGEAIITEGENGKGAFLILSGLAVMSGAPHSEPFADDQLLPGTLVGELAMLSDIVFSTTVVATQPVQALAIDRDALYRLMENEPELADHFSDRLLARLISIADDLRAVDMQFEALENSLQHASA
jgi:CRP-like cAMP-binding protein